MRRRGLIALLVVWVLSSGFGAYVAYRADQTSTGISKGGK